jgi:hypothetical protein
VRKKYFPFFSLIFFLWFFLIKFLCTDLAMIHISVPRLNMETPPSSSPHEQ